MASLCRHQALYHSLKLIVLQFSQAMPKPLALYAGFNAIKGRKGPDGRPLTDEALQQEAAQIQESLVTIESRIQQARQELARMTNRDEQDVWETNLVILQVTHFGRTAHISEGSPCSSAFLHRWR